MYIPSLEVFVQVVITGITSGALYGLIGVGMTLILGVMRLINFAHGDFYTLGAYITFILVETLRIPLGIAVPLVAAILAVVGVVAEKLTIYPLRLRSRETWVLASLGLSIVLKNTILLLFSPEPRKIWVDYTRNVLEIQGIRILTYRLFIIMVVAITFVLLHLFINRTKIGKAMRAVAQNREAATSLGIVAEKINSLTFAIGVGLVGIAGAIIAPLFLVYPGMGEGVILKAFVIVILGGLGNIMGAMTSGFLLGITEVIAVLFINPAYKDVVSFVFLILVLAFRMKKIEGE